MVIRSWKSCAFWFLLILAPGLVLLWRGDNSRELIIGMGLLALFGLQGLVAELLGIRISDAGVSFPRRLSPSLPFFVAWRRRVTPEEISRIDTAERGGLRLSLTSSEIVDVPMPDAHYARDVVRFARQFY
jgi:hypothetical protein